jgi:hypothetical protein
MSAIEDAVCADIQTRAEIGLKKYGVSVEKANLSDTQWLQHAYEESLDFSVYLKKILTTRAALDATDLGRP